MVLCLARLSSIKSILAETSTNSASDTNIFWAWSSPLISGSYLSSFIPVSDICPFNSSAVFLAAMSREVGHNPVNIKHLIKCETVVTTASICLEMVLESLPLTCFSIMLFLSSWDNFVFSFLCSMFSVIHTTMPNSTVITFQTLNRQQLSVFRLIARHMGC